ncbi:MAG: 30S ribosomal protein S12 methylthiotransferase RimO, partial [Actinobacteria bacterium]|nr:30S ribosomal protein S12 methylthiotransferase RimO [Actinomycetota bacterium]
MPRRHTSQTRLYVHTLGCPKNDADSRSVMRSASAAGATLVDDPALATHILINTCGFIQDAKEESIGAI